MRNDREVPGAARAQTVKGGGPSISREDQAADVHAGGAEFSGYVDEERGMEEAQGTAVGHGKDVGKQGKVVSQVAHHVHLLEHALHWHPHDLHA